MTDTKKLWKVLGGILLVSFGILLFMGRQIYLTMPPIPAEVRTTSGETLYTKADIQTGQKAVEAKLDEIIGKQVSVKQRAMRNRYAHSPG